MGYDTKLHHQKGRKMFINSHLLHILVVWLGRRFQLGVDIDVHAFALGQFLFFCLVLYVSHISPQIRVMSTLNFLPLLWTWSEFHNSTCWLELNISSKTYQSYHVQNNYASTKQCMPIFVSNLQFFIIFPKSKSNNWLLFQFTFTAYTILISNSC